MESNGFSRDFAQTLMESRKYWIIYLILIVLTCMSTITFKKLPNPQFVVPVFIIVALLGVFCIVYYFMHDSKEELYKVAFVIIVCFGMISALIVPIVDVSDELEHLTRAEITSRGCCFLIGKVVSIIWTDYTIIPMREGTVRSLILAWVLKRHRAIRSL